jgi:hypothetical protein
METQQIYEYLQKDQIEPVLNYLKTTKTEDIFQKSVISRLFNKLDEKLQWKEIVSLLTLYAKDYSNSFDYEYNQGLKILLNRRQFDNLFEILNLLLSHKKKLDNITSLIQDLFNSCFDQKRSIEKCVDLILAMKGGNCNLSDNFWGVNIIALLRLGMMSQGLELIKFYPIKVYIN